MGVHWGLVSFSHGFDSFFSFFLKKNLLSAVDRLEGELMSELENGRLVRLLCKFGFINERPECV